MQEHTIPWNARVRERATLECGIVLDRGWWVDLNTDAPAVPHYLIAFDNGRELKLPEDEIEECKPPMFTCPGCGRDTDIIFNRANCPACTGRD